MQSIKLAFIFSFEKLKQGKINCLIERPVIDSVMKTYSADTILYKTTARSFLFLMNFIIYYRYNSCVHNRRVDNMVD